MKVVFPLHKTQKLEHKKSEIRMPVIFYFMTWIVGEGLELNLELISMISMI